MPIHSEGISLTSFTTCTSEETSPWSVKFLRVGNVLQVSMHWNGKLEPTHKVLVRYDEFVDQLTKI